MTVMGSRIIGVQKQENKETFSLPQSCVIVAWSLDTAVLQLELDATLSKVYHLLFLCKLSSSSCFYIEALILRIQL